MAQTVKHVPTMRETRVQSLGREDLLEKEVATHSSILATPPPPPMICISEVIDISPGNLDSSLCFIQPSFLVMW